MWGHLQSMSQRKDEHNTIYLQLTSTTYIRSVANRVTASLTNEVIHSHKQSLSIFLIAVYPCAITRDTAIILSYSCNRLTPIWKRRTICIMLPTHVKPGYYSSRWNAIHIAMITHDDKQQNTLLVPYPYWNGCMNEWRNECMYIWLDGWSYTDVWRRREWMHSRSNEEMMLCRRRCVCVCRFKMWIHLLKSLKQFCMNLGEDYLICYDEFLPMYIVLPLIHLANEKIEKYHGTFQFWFVIDSSVHTNKLVLRKCLTYVKGCHCSKLLSLVSANRKNKQMIIVELS